MKYPRALWNGPKKIGGSKLRMLYLAAIALLVLMPVVGWSAAPDAWQWRNPRPQGNPLQAITYANSTFVAVGEGGTILTSADGIAWTRRTSGVTTPLYGVAYGNGTFVAVGWTGKTLTSPDGISWTQRTSGITRPLYGVAYGNGTFVAVGDGGTILTSADGITWTSTDLWGVRYSLRNHLRQRHFRGGG